MISPCLLLQVLSVLCICNISPLPHHLPLWSSTGPKHCWHSPINLEPISQYFITPFCHHRENRQPNPLRQPPSPYSSIFVVNFSLLALHKRYTNALLHSTTVTTAITTTETHHSYNFHTVKQLVNVPFSVRVPQQHIYTTTPNIVGHFQCSHYHFGLLLWVALVLVSHCSEWMNANWITQRHKPQNDLILFFLFHCFVTTATLIYKLFLF